ncbi:MAG: UDP-galactopyranose mutase, partial [Acutalibacteraceae bacterium]|nr:UDP-galactopyranose mutase [Acutalibacteraceae bacterium]
PVRFTYDNNYFNDRDQVIPIGGYNGIIEKLLDGAEIRLDTDFFSDRDNLAASAKKILFCGMIDEYFGYCCGELEYRSLRFENEVLETDNFQGNAVVNYNEYEIPYTRIIEHKHFEFVKSEKTVITREYPAKWEKGDEPYYPINDEKNAEIYKKYTELAEKEDKVIFGGRLGMYKYFDMDDTIAAALKLAGKVL